MPLDVRSDYAGPSPVTGSVTTTNSDAVVLMILGQNWSTVRFDVVLGGSATVKAQYSTEANPLNWLTAPYARKTSALSANPTTQAIAATTLVTGDSWEVPLPANCTAFRLACDGTGTITTVRLSGGLPWLPGMPVVAVLYDVAESGTGVGIPSTVFDFSGWSVADIALVTPTTQVWSFTTLDDAGTAVGPSVVSTAAGSARMIISPGAGAAGPATLGASAHQPYAIGERRFALVLPAGGTVSAGRARVVARR